MTKKRTRRTRDEWRSLVAELNSSGMSMSAYARERGVSLWSLSYWKQKLAGSTSSASMTARSKSTFSEVVVIPPMRSMPRRIEVLTRGGSTIRLEGGFDAAMLRDVLRVVESC